MPATAQKPVSVQQQSLVLTNISWRDYIRLGRIFGDRPIRLTYDRGTLEIAMPLFLHERIKKLLSKLIDALTQELNIVVVSGGSTTCKRRKKKRGFEPDECNWIANEPAVRGKDHIDLETDPPPDLGLEIDITHSSIKRMGIYAAMNVPEVWRFGKKGLTFNALQANGKYAVIPSSLAFPGLTPADLMSFLSLRSQQDENSIVKAFRAWVRQRFGTTNPTP